MATDDPIIGNCYLTISADKTEIIEGESVQFTIELFGGCSGDISVDILIDNIIDNQYLSNGSLLYTHTFNESGEFTVSVDTGTGSSIVGDSINITVEEATIELPTSQVSWGINNKNVQLIEINNKEVKSIITNNGKVLYRKKEDVENVLELQFTGSNFSTYLNTSPFTYTGKVFVDWGDDTGLIEYTGGKLSHSYSANETYAIKIYGNITSLETHCFDSCSGLTFVIIPDSVTSLGNYCFYGCSGLASIIIPDSVTSLGNYCFYNCSGLTSVIIPDSVISLGDYCFYGCSNLTSIIIPNGVTNLGESCFSSCVNLASVIIPDSVPSLKSNCFTNCSSLISITIPNGVTTLSNYCFTGCSNLTSINLNWDTSNEILTYNSSWISGANNNLKFNIPNGTTSLYTAKGYPSNKLMEIGNISLSSDKNILSYYDNDTVTLSATVTSSNNEPISGITVEFFNGNTSLGTAITNSSGIATKTYTSSGSGDVVFSATGNNLTSQPITVEDCKYWNITELSLSGTNKHQAYDSNLSVALTTDCEISFDVQILNAVENNDYRYWLIPKSSMNGMTYPQNALFFDKKPSAIVYDQQVNGTYKYGSSRKRFSTNTGYINFKYVKNGTTIKIYVDDTYLFEDTASWIDNYNDYTISLMKWSGTATMYIKNVKFKALNSISLVASEPVLSYADSDSTTLTATHSLGTGKTVNLYNASDDTLMGAMTDNEDGTYSYTYNSQGVGDLTVYASDGNITSEDILIEDCLLYKSTLSTGDNVPINISNITIPTNFKAIFNVKQLRSTNSMGGLYIGTNSTNRILFGKIGSNGFVGIYVYRNGSTVASIHQENVYQNNQVSETVYTYNDGVQTITANEVTKQLTNSSITDRSYLISNITDGGAEITELKIKPYQSKQSSIEDSTDELSGSELDP